MPIDPRQRIHDLHAWYQRNVMNMRLTAEVERLWHEWLKAGYNGPDLRDVIRYIRKQISLGKRNEGALKLSNLLARSETGFLGFDEDLALARARGNLRTDRPLEPAPDEGGTNASGAATVSPVIRAPLGRATSPTVPLTDEQRAEYARQLKSFSTPSARAAST